MSDEGFREIQLNGKQLIFLFMAATVVLVVTFLFGVLVGVAACVVDCTRPIRHRDGRCRCPAAGPRGRQPATAELPTLRPPRRASHSRPAGAPKPRAAARSATPPRGRAELPRAAVAGAAPPEENLKRRHPAVARRCSRSRHKAAAVAPVASRNPRRSSSAAPAPTTDRRRLLTPPLSAASSDPSGPGFAVQVAISKDRREADTLAKELIAKGYPAFVMDPAKGAPAGIYRVRVGKYKNP